MKPVFKFILVIVVISILAFSAGVVSADGLTLVSPIRWDNFPDFLNGIINYLFWFGLALAPVFIIVAAFYFVTAAGNKNQIETGKRIITYTVIGLVLIIMAKGAVELVERMFR